MELKFMSEPPLDATLLTCPYCGEEEHIWIHSQQERRLCCGTCGGTFTESKGTSLSGLRYPRWLVLVVVSLLAHGCPVPAIVFAFMLDERTVVDWQTRVGRHAKRVQAELVCQGDLALGQVQADELYVKTQQGPVWVATAMDVFTRLFIWAEVGAERKTALIERVVRRVRAAVRRGTPILWVTDDFGAWADAVRRVFRDPVHTGKRGRPRLPLWACQFAHVAVPAVCGNSVPPVCGRSVPPRRSVVGKLRVTTGSISVVQDQLLHPAIGASYLRKPHLSLCVRHGLSFSPG